MQTKLKSVFGYDSTFNLKMSLIVATLGRDIELVRFLDFLCKQEYLNFEVVVVDQNENELLKPILNSFADRLSIKHIRCQRGLSHARNVGLKHISGDVVVFPDDDCWYSSDVLKKVAIFMDAHPEYAGLTGRSIDDQRPNAYRWFHLRSGSVTKINVCRRATSYTIFLRSEVIGATGEFDEGLGVGAESGRIAAEELDYLVRVLNAGYDIYYDHQLCVFHREPRVDSKGLRKRAYGYSLGWGYFLRKHRYPLWFVLNQWFRAAGGILLNAIAGDIETARYHLAVLKGRIQGWRC
jgi:glycosyltransferase involved in cell wall biosynthesis